MLVNLYIKEEKKPNMKALKVEEAVQIKVCSSKAVGEAHSPHKSQAVWQGSGISHLLLGALGQAPSPEAAASCWPRASPGPPPSKGPFGRERTRCHRAKGKMLWLPSLQLSPPSHSWIRPSPSQAEGRREGKTCWQGGLGDSSLFVTLAKCHGAASVK